MTQLPRDQSNTRPWLVYEAGDRWAGATRRFAPELMPPPLVASVIAARPATGTTAHLAHPLSPRTRAVVLWEIDPAGFSHACDSLAAIAIEYPGTLRLAAAAGLSDRRRMVLSELAVAAMIAHPEDLPGLATMIRAYFAIPSHLLD